MADAVEIIQCMVVGLWLFIPAMLPNSQAALVGKWGKTKIDFGRTWRGKRIFGDGKSWLGLFFGIISGIIIGFIQLGISWFDDPAGFWGFGPFWSNAGIIVCLSTGALLGDLCGAFIKRRLGLERGHKVPVLDQYDFVAGSMILTAIFFPNFIWSTYFEGYHIAAFIFLLVATYATHRAVNIIGYKMGVKDEPW